MNFKYIDILNLDEAIMWFHEVFHKAHDYDSWVKAEEDLAVQLAVDGTGEAIKIVLGFWLTDVQPTLVVFFNNLGIYHADDMCEIIIRSYHRKENKRGLALDQQIKTIRNHWDIVSPEMNKGKMR